MGGRRRPSRQGEELLLGQDTRERADPAKDASHMRSAEATARSELNRQAVQTDGGSVADRADRQQRCAPRRQPEALPENRAPPPTTAVYVAHLLLSAVYGKRLNPGSPPWGENLEVSHVCGNQACIKPSHLRAVSRKENNKDIPHHKVAPGTSRKYHPRQQ